MYINDLADICIHDETDIYIFMQMMRKYINMFLVRQIKISYRCHWANCMTVQTRGCSL